MPRWVVLHHACPPHFPRPSHWDLMFECGGALRTWAVEQSPDSATPQVAEKLGDHRIDYLSYEGPVSGDRGQVTRWDAGDYELLDEAADRFEVRLAGQKLRGCVLLTRAVGETAGAQCWNFSLERK